MDQKEIVFSCGEKCRICPYPGANCKRTARGVQGAEREEDRDRIWMDQELKRELTRQMQILHK